MIFLLLSGKKAAFYSYRSMRQSFQFIQDVWGNVKHCVKNVGNTRKIQLHRMICRWYAFLNALRIRVNLAPFHWPLRYTIILSTRSCDTAKQQISDPIISILILIPKIVIQHLKEIRFPYTHLVQNTLSKIINSTS